MGVAAGTARGAGVADRGEGRLAADGAVEPAVHAPHTRASATSPASALHRVMNRNLPHEIRIREAQPQVQPSSAAFDRRPPRLLSSCGHLGRPLGAWPGGGSFLAVSRYVTHAVVLLLALALSGYASLGRGLPASLSLRLGEVNAEGLVIGEGGQVGNVQLGRLSTIVKPIAIPTDAPISHVPKVYEVQDGETLKDLAARFNVSVEDIRWSNFSDLKNTAKDVVKGQKVVVPPVDGIVVTTQQGDTPISLGNTYHVPPAAIVDFNYLRSSDQDPLMPNAQLVVPGGKGPDFERPLARNPYSVTVGTAGYSVGPFTGSYSVAPGNRFPYGYCTWYVYNRRP